MTTPPEHWVGSRCHHRKVIIQRLSKFAWRFACVYLEVAVTPISFAITPLWLEVSRSFTPGIRTPGPGTYATALTMWRDAAKCYSGRLLSWSVAVHDGQRNDASVRQAELIKPSTAPPLDTAIRERLQNSEKSQELMHDLASYPLDLTHSGFASPAIEQHFHISDCANALETLGCVLVSWKPIRRVSTPATGIGHKRMRVTKDQTRLIARVLPLMQNKMPLFFLLISLSSYRLIPTLQSLAAQRSLSETSTVPLTST